jgi:hypothetical protein
MKIMNRLLLIAAVMLLMGCSAENKLRRARKLIDDAEKLGATFAADTVFKTIEIPIPSSSVDSVVKVVLWTDTIRVEKDRVKTAVVVTPEKRIVYIRSECVPDTIRIKVPVTITKSIEIIEKKPTFWKRLQDFGTKIAGWLFFLALGALLGRMFWR